MLRRRTPASPAHVTPMVPSANHVSQIQARPLLASQRGRAGVRRVLGVWDVTGVLSVIWATRPASAAIAALKEAPMMTRVYHPACARKTWREKIATAANWVSTIFKVTIGVVVKSAPVWAFPVSALPPHGPIRMRPL